MGTAVGGAVIVAAMWENTTKAETQTTKQAVSIVFF